MDEKNIIELMPDVFDYNNDGKAQAFVGQDGFSNWSIKDEVESEWVKIESDTMRQIAYYVRQLNQSFANSGLQPKDIIEVLKIILRSQDAIIICEDNYDNILTLFQGLEFITDNVNESVKVNILDVAESIIEEDATYKFSLSSFLCSDKINNQKRVFLLRTTIKEDEEFIVMFGNDNFKCRIVKIDGIDNYLYLGGVNQEGLSDYSEYPFMIKIDILKKEAEIFSELLTDQDIYLKIFRSLSKMTLVDCTDDLENERLVIVDPTAGFYIINYEDFPTRYIYNDGLNMVAKYRNSWEYYSGEKIENFNGDGTVISVKIITNDLVSVNSIEVISNEL